MIFKLFFNNTFDNIKSINHNLLLGNLKGVFKDVPAILVAGGPSLNKNIDLIAEAKGKALIIAVDAALPTLLAHNITPDIVGAIDAKELACEKISGLASYAKDFFLICTPAVHSKTPKTFPAKQIIWGFTRTDIDQHLAKLLNVNSVIEPVGTVAHMNLMFARTLGCSPLIMVGQDLALLPTKGGATHAKGAILNSNFTPDHKNCFWVDGTTGGKVPATRGYLFLRQHLEHLINEHPGHYINATEGGANIKGTEVLPLKKVLGKYCTKNQPTLTNINTHIIGSRTPNPSKLIEWLGSTLKEAKKTNKTIQKTNQLTTNTCNKIKLLQKNGKPCQSFESLPPSLQKQIHQIDKEQEQADHPMKIWQFLSDITGQGLRAEQRYQQEILTLKNSPGKYLQYALKSMERILITNNVRLNALKILEENLEKNLSHHEKESILLAALKKDDQNKQHRLELARFYFNSDELVLAQTLLENLHSSQPDSAEINFLLGCIATKQENQTDAENFFTQAIKINPEYTPGIQKLRQQISDKYFTLWQRHPFPHLLQKSQFYNRDNPKTKAALALKQINDAHQSENPEKTDELIRLWHDKLENDQELSANISAKHIAMFYGHHGQLLMLEGKTSEAIKSFQKATNFTPDNPNYHIILTEAFFASGEFDLGVGHLKKAVQINPAYAKHWEEIGDQLREDEQNHDAIASYEQCFAAQPENLSLIKKIAECYQALDMHEAALKAYTLLKQRLEELHHN